MGAYFVGIHRPFEFNTSSELVDNLYYYTSLSRPWFVHKKAKWNTVIEPPFAEILTQNGIGYTFNLMNMSELLYEDR